MGRVKAFMMEMEEHGYDFLGKGEKNVCTHHFEDKYLNGYIKKHGEFTDKNGRHVDGLIYESCKTKKANVVLFCNNEDSSNWVALESFSTEK